MSFPQPPRPPQLPRPPRPPQAPRPQCLGPTCSLGYNDISQRFPNLKFRPRAEPDHKDRDHREWKKEYEYWRDLRCECGLGYICREHGGWISGDEVRTGTAPASERQQRGSCPKSHYEDIEGYVGRRGAKSDGSGSSSTSRQKPTITRNASESVPYQSIQTTSYGGQQYAWPPQTHYEQHTQHGPAYSQLIQQESTPYHSTHDTGTSGSVSEDQADKAPIAIDYAVATQQYHSPNNENAEYRRQISISKGDRIIVYSYPVEHWADVKNHTTGETGLVWLDYIALDSEVLSGHT